MKEKLIKLMYHATCESDLEGKPGSCPYRKYGRCGEIERLDMCAITHLAEELLANGVTVQQWIPVSERKPDLELVEVENQDMDLFPCLVSKVSQGQCRKTVVTKAWWDGLHFMDNDCIYITKYVTHWMPLPIPPKEG